MILKKFFADTAFICCMFEKFFIITFNTKIFGNFLTYLSSSTAVLTTNCNN